MPSYCVLYGGNMEVAIERGNLVTVCRYAVKSLIDRACCDVIDDGNEELRNLCAILEHILSHRMKPSHTWYGGDGGRSFFDYIKAACSRMPHHCLASVEAMRPPQSRRGKGRAWIYMALMEKRLSEYISTALQQTHLTSSFYLADSIMQSDSSNLIAGMLLGLNAIDFSFDLKDVELDFAAPPAIDYTPYLKFDMTTSNLVGMETAGSDQRHIFPPTAEERPLGEHFWKERFNKLNDQYRILSEQKGYLEELVRLRDNQLDEIRHQREHLMMAHHHFEVDSRQNRQQLESIVIELQAKVNDLKLDHQHEVQALQAIQRRHVCGASFPPAIVMSQLMSAEQSAHEDDVSSDTPRQPLSRQQRRGGGRGGVQHPSPIETEPPTAPGSPAPAILKAMEQDSRSVQSAASIGVATGVGPADCQSLVALAGSYCSQDSGRSGDVSSPLPPPSDTAPPSLPPPVVAPPSDELRRQPGDGLAVKVVDPDPMSQDWDCLDQESLEGDEKGTHATDSARMSAGAARTGHDVESDDR